jgi:hypothetical protein
MLIASALGNIVSQYLKKYRKWVVLGSTLCIAAFLIFYIFGLDHFLAIYVSKSMVIRLGICLLVVFPISFFMGIPYPNGLDSLQESRPHLLPWAWGMNGGFSVAGSTLARLISIASGFSVLLVITMILYVGVGVLFKVNEQ